MAEDDRMVWIAQLRKAVRDPSIAKPIAAMVRDQMQAAAANGGVVPEGYIYHGAHHWLAQVRDLEVEELPDAQNPRRPQITNTTNEPIPIKVPFDCLIMGVAGWAIADLGPPFTGTTPFLSCAQDGRDLFSCDWELDGQADFSTNGRTRLMFPASTTVGTRNRPRPMAWMLRRNQTIGVRFRSLVNIKLPPVAELPVEFDGEYPVLRRASVAFIALNLGSP